MNARAVEVLVGAALRGEKQARSLLHDPDPDGGDCALGKLHVAMHANRQEAVACRDNGPHGYFIYLAVGLAYDIDYEERSKIMLMNDKDGADLLTIARKFGPDV